MSKTPPHPDLLLACAETFGTPTYVYFESIIRERCQLLRDNLAGLPLRLLYAIKANYHPEILKIIANEGLGVDAVSMGEVLLALRVGIAPEQILFSANNMTDAEMHAAVEAGVLLNIGELSRLEKFGQAYPQSRVCVRLNPDVGAGHHAHVITAGEKAKFGIPTSAVADIQACADRYGLHIIGLHQHIGSGILEARHFWEAIRVLLAVAPAFSNLEFLNFGGGLGIPYRATDTAIDLENFQQMIVAPLQDFLQLHPHINFWFEPGRYFVAEAGVLLTKVNTLKTTPTRTFAGVDSGFNHLIRPMVYGAYHAIVNVSHPDGLLQPYDVTGNICESGDLFARAEPIAKIREGDLLAILDTGAYGMSMASHYNLRPLPAEVLVRPDQTLHLMRSRQTDADLIQNLFNSPSY